MKQKSNQKRAGSLMGLLFLLKKLDDSNILCYDVHENL